MKGNKIKLEREVNYMTDITVIISMILGIVIWGKFGKIMWIDMQIAVYILAVGLLMYGFFAHHVIPNMFFDIRVFDERIEAKLGKKCKEFDVKDIKEIAIIPKYSLFDKKDDRIRDLYVVISKKDNMYKSSKVKHTQVKSNYIVISLGSLETLEGLMPFLKSYSKPIIDIEKYEQYYGEDGWALLSSLVK